MSKGDAATGGQRLMDLGRESLPTRLERYLRSSGWPATTRVIACTEFTGGAARSTFGVDVTFGEVDDSSNLQRLILRLDPADDDGSLVPSDMLREYAWYQAVHATNAVPVPDPILVEADLSWLGAAFMISRRVAGVADASTIYGSRFDAVRRDISLEAFSLLGRLAAHGVLEIGPAAGKSRTATTPWREQLDEWDAELLRHQLGPMPITREAVRVLRNNPPPPPDTLCVVHGDFRLGNFMYSEEGFVSLLDWEMAHVGDPHEDLAYSALKLWARHDPAKVWGILSQEESWAAWSEASGIAVREESIAWWTLFNLVKMTALWVRGASATIGGRSNRLQYLTAHLFITPEQEMQMLTSMEAVRS